MIQAIGLTSLPRRHQLEPAVDDLTFEARPGRVTVLLGPESSGKTTALRLMLGLETGRGTALFRGRPVHRIQHLAREVGVLLSEVNGHPGRTARGHLRMLAAAAGFPAARADEVLDVVGLSGLADQRMSTLSRGMDRRLGMACALLGDPHTLVLDEPAHELSPRETAWLYSLIRGYAQQGGTVLVTSRQSEEAAQLADRVVSIDSGRLVADQEAADFVRTRLRPRVAVRTPHAERLAAVLTQEGRKAGRNRDKGPLKVVHEGGTRLSVYGSSCAEVGEWAHRSGILVHQLADERGDAGDVHAPEPLDRADGRRADAGAPDADSEPEHDETALTESSETPTDRPVTAQEELDELEEFAKFEEDAANTDAAADPDSAPPANSRPVDDSSSTATEAKSPEPPTSAVAEAANSTDSTARPGTESETDDSDPSGDADDAHPNNAAPEARTVGPVLGDLTPDAGTPGPAPEPAPDPDREPVLVTAPASPASSTAAFLAPETPSPFSEAQTVRISDTPLEAEPADSAQQNRDARDAEAHAPEFSATEPPTPESLERETPESLPRVLLKPLADPDARGKAKSLWTPVPSAPSASAAAELPPQLVAIARPGPAAPLRYELCRLFSVRSTWIALALTVAVAFCAALLMARTGMGLPSSSGGSPAPAVRLLTGWPSGGIFVLPPVAVAAGLLGAFAFGEEFRYPALAPARSPVPRRLSLLAAKLAVSALLTVVLSLVVAVVNAAGVTLLLGSGALALPGDAASASAGGSWRLHVAGVFVFAAGCAWAGVLAAGIFRSGAIGTAVVVAVPLLLAPLAGTLLGDGPAASAAQSAASASSGGSAGGVPGGLEAALLMPWPPGAERWVSTALALVSQPMGAALALTLAVLLTAYLIAAFSSKAR
ncbi:ATP-binding cassette domain-containing protein [Streptomyces nanshensis]|uniref:ABC transporter domain-containing protein n=1 Tax=Streptomyces nanshensis TaxID=518642 RepID=A0A1E7KXJ6_9ACTN|nr:ATP-binding cassette domain-containing protein [Streptomyces nanshensis]OEV08636.1 hypothetical protein AN218_25635 [Streptomyces nanshensis]